MTRFDTETSHVYPSVRRQDDRENREHEWLVTQSSVRATTITILRPDVRFLQNAVGTLSSIPESSRMNVYIMGGTFITHLLPTTYAVYLHWRQPHGRANTGLVRPRTHRLATKHYSRPARKSGRALLTHKYITCRFLYTQALWLKNCM